MLKQHSPCLWRISACVGNMSGVDPRIAAYALEQTIMELSGRYDCTPLVIALNELKGY